MNVNKGTRHAAICAENWAKDSTSGRPDSSFTCTSLTLLSLSVNGVAEAILKLRNGVRLFVRKVVSGVRVCTLCSTLAIDGSLLVWEVRMGFTWGQVRIAHLLDDEMEDHQISAELATDAQVFLPGRTMVIPFQNENLCP